MILQFLIAFLYAHLCCSWHVFVKGENQDHLHRGRDQLLVADDK